MRGEDLAAFDLDRSTEMECRMISSGDIAGFKSHRLPGDGVAIDALVGGKGPPVLLLHGFPQTRMAWRNVAPILAQNFTVVIPDLRGYGRSKKPKDAGDHAAYSKRRMAADQMATMRSLGFETFAVAGHDRGARVAYRLAIDCPAAVKRLAVIDIIPTADVWKAGAEAGMGLYHWFFLAQPAPLPEQLLAGRTDTFLRWTFEGWAAKGFVFPQDSMADYLETFRDEDTIRAACEDYRAGWSVDRVDDEEDRGVRLIEAPTLVLWGGQGPAEKSAPLEKWRSWAKDVRGHGLPCGHFVPEEAPLETAAALREFFLST